MDTREQTRVTLEQAAREAGISRHDGTAPKSARASTLRAVRTINIGELQQLARQRLET